ncbi:hypothetical protein DAEQUDRAFT_731629 [Daedalea quercina L-15889]|uniref:C2H2-type domain-containing protein n=1 Tax=Daedalea quercina L-15889 TaxID=1314783 RepID=A0A165M506_9APHY|nr:hypothetical protein DAEQUDRAFT_731629 [Daedalea quercina L-15889]
MPTSSESDGYLFAPEHNSVGDLTSGLMLTPMELPELDLPFRPLDMARSTEIYAMESDEMIDSGAMPLQFDDDCGASLGTSYGITYEMLEAAQVSPWRDPLSSSHLLPSRVFSSSSMMAMSAPSHETEPQTVSPSMLHSPYTAGSSTLSPTSTSGAPFTPFSSSADPLPSLWTSPPQESQISPTSTFGAGSIAPATKSLGADSDDHVSVYDNAEPYDSQHARYTSRTPPLLRSPSPPSVIRRAASRPSGPVSVPRPTKRKHGPSQPPQRQAASLSTREVLPLPKRSANRAVVEKSTTTRLHPLPGCNLRSRRSVATEEPVSPHPSTMQLGVVVDAAHDDESEDIPIDGDGSDEDDSEYEPSPKKVCVSAGAQRETKKSVTTQGTERKRGTGGPARRGRGSRTEGGSRRGNFSCTDPECDLVFTRETDMKRHVECVHKKRGVFCPGCNRTYARVDSHRRHLKNGECPKAKPVQRGEPYDEEEHEAESEDDEL